MKEAKIDAQYDILVATLYTTLYTILKRLILDNMVEVNSIEYEGRLRKYYHITEKGISEIERFKNEWEELMKIYSFILEK